MKTSHILLLAVLLILSVAQNLDSQRPKIPNARRPISGSFAASWLGGFCFKSNKCDSYHLDLWDRESFTIHGLWPNPATTRRYDDFDVHNIHDEELLDDMDNFWPPQSNSDKSDYWLWEHEYNKHGKDYAQILQIYQPEEFGRASSQRLQETFFHHAIEFYKSQNLQKIDLSKATEAPTSNNYGDLIVTKKQLAEILGVSPDHFIVSCNRGKDWLMEVQYCLRFQTDLSITLESCRTIVANKETPYPTVDTCPSHFRLIGYKRPGVSSQERVTDLDYEEEYDE